MKKIILLLFLVAAAGFAGCNQSSSNTAPSANSTITNASPSMSPTNKPGI